MEVRKLTASKQPPKILIYGRPGVGKTVLACQAPKPLLFIDCDLQGVQWVGSAKAADGTPLIPQEELDEISVIDSPTPQEFEDMVNALRNAGPGKYKRIVVDSLTDLQTIHRETIMGPRLIASRANYGENTEWMRRMIKALGMAKVTVVYVTREDTTIDEETLLVRPGLTPALLRAVEGMLPIIAYLGSSTTLEEGNTKVRRRLLAVNTDKIRAKDRTGLMPPLVDDPTWAKAFGALYEQEAT